MNNHTVYINRYARQFNHDKIYQRFTRKLSNMYDENNIKYGLMVKEINMEKGTVQVK